MRRPSTPRSTSWPAGRARSDARVSRSCSRPWPSAASAAATNGGAPGAQVTRAASAVQNGAEEQVDDEKLVAAKADVNADDDQDDVDAVLDASDGYEDEDEAEADTEDDTEDDRGDEDDDFEAPPPAAFPPISGMRRRATPKPPRSRG